VRPSPANSADLKAPRDLKSRDSLPIRETEITRLHMLGRPSKSVGCVMTEEQQQAQETRHALQEAIDRRDNGGEYGRHDLAVSAP
jgi:hypothetical protein